LTPQVGLIGDLKMSLSEKCGIPGHLLCIAAMVHETESAALQIYSDSNPLRTVGEEQTLYAFEMVADFSDILGHPMPEVAASASGGSSGGAERGGRRSGGSSAGEPDFGRLLFV
jgi:hypothetical protein